MLARVVLTVLSMSDGVNKVQLIGNLGADPELKTLQNGNVLSFRVATNDTWIDKEGVKQTRTEWHRVKVFGNRAEGLGRILKSGSKVWVEGRIATSTYEKDGQKKFSHEVIAWEVIPLANMRPKAMGEAPGLANGSLRAPVFDAVADAPF